MSAELSPPAVPRRTFGAYVVLGPLGSGGMASVCLAHDPSGRAVAIKSLHSAVAEQPELVRDFLREATIASRVNHPNVVGVSESATQNGLPYLVMEYVDGGTLSALQRLAHKNRKPMPVGVAVRIVLDVLAGLHAAHELLTPDGRPSELVHRDVSPQNVLVGRSGVAKITDFGVARIVDRTSMTSAGMVKGKLRYMSPEQLVGHGVDRRTDIWAMGVVLWELLANRRLFQGEYGNVVFELVSGSTPQLRELRPEISAALAACAHGALARECSERPQTAAAMQHELESTGCASTHAEVARYLESTLGDDLRVRDASVAALAMVTSEHTRTRVMPMQRWRALPIAGAALLLLLMGGGLWGKGALISQRAPVALRTASRPASLQSELPVVPSYFVVESPLPLASLEVRRGDAVASLGIAPGTRRVEVAKPLQDARIVATSTDGRQAELIPGEAQQGTLVFGPRTATPKTRPASPKRDLKVKFQ